MHGELILFKLSFPVIYNNFQFLRVLSNRDMNQVRIQIYFKKERNGKSIKGGVEVFKRILFIQVMNVNNREIQTNICFSPLTFFSSVSALYHYIFFSIL